MEAALVPIAVSCKVPKSEPTGNNPTLLEIAALVFVVFIFPPVIVAVESKLPVNCNPAELYFKLAPAPPTKLNLPAPSI